ncbi:MAG: hypothetical protein V5A33_06925, partial [Halobacteriales archaeon]
MSNVPIAWDGADPASVGRKLASALPARPRTIAGLLAFVPVALATLVRVWNNAPGGLPADVHAARPAISALAVVGPASAAVVLAVATDEDAIRVGLLSVGVFGFLGGFVEGAAVAAIGAVVGGTAVAIGTHLGAPRDWRTGRKVVVASTILGATAVSLAATSGVDPATLRPVGSTVALLGLAATPALVRPRLPEVGIGAAGFGVVIVLGTGAPYVTGAVALVAGGVVGASLLAIALGVAGALTATAATLR